LRVLLACCIIALASRIAASAADQFTCAVLTFEAGQGVRIGQAALLSSKSAMLAAQTGRRRVLSRLQVNRSLLASGFRRSMYRSSREAALAAGKLLHVDLVVSGTIEWDGARYTLDTFLLDARTGRLTANVTSHYAGSIENMARHALPQNIRTLFGLKVPLPKLEKPRPRPPERIEREPAEKKAPPKPVVRKPRAKPVPPKPVRRRAKRPPRRPTPALALRKEWERLMARAAPNADVMFTRIKKLEMTESGGPETRSRFKHYRVSSDRFLFSAGYLIDGKYDISGTFGFADLCLHGSEGQTREFDSTLAWGFNFRALLEHPECRLGFLGSASFLTFETDDDAITKVMEHMGFRSWENLSVNWSEFNVAAAAVVRQEKTRVYGGIRYTTISADEDGAFRGESFTAELDQEDSFGILAGIECDIWDHLDARFEVDILDSTTFGIGLGYQF